MRDGYSCVESVDQYVMVMHICAALHMCLVMGNLRPWGRSEGHLSRLDHPRIRMSKALVCLVSLCRREYRSHLGCLNKEERVLFMPSHTCMCVPPKLCMCHALVHVCAMPPHASPCLLHLHTLGLLDLCLRQYHNFLQYL